MTMTIISNVISRLILSVIFLNVSQNIKELWICAQNYQNLPCMKQVVTFLAVPNNFKKTFSPKLHIHVHVIQAPRIGRNEFGI